MTQSIPIPKISAMYIDKNIETRGYVTRVFPPNNIEIQEVSRSLKENNLMPFTIRVHYDKYEIIDCGQYVKVTGIPKIIQHKGSHVALLYIECSDITIITEDEADLSRNEFCDTFFTDRQLKDMKADDYSDLLKAFRMHANDEGFELVCLNSASDGKLRLRCHLHSLKGKNPLLNTACPFFINIRRNKDSITKKFFWKVATTSLQHNHQKDPFVYIHKVLNVDLKKIIVSMVNNGVDTQLVAKIVHENYNHFISSQQIADICRKDKKIKLCQRIAESEELRLYMESTNGHFLYDDKDLDKKENVVRRKVFATFTQEEYNNLKEYGDFVSIDPTFCLMSSKWSVIPLTVIGSEREIRSGGIIFASSNSHKIFRWILSILVNDLPSKDKIHTICSDDDLGLAGAYSETLCLENKTDVDQKILQLNRVICFWHKIENFVRFVATLQLPQNEEKKVISYFRIMGMTRDEKVLEECHNKLSENEKIKQYLLENVDEKIDIIAKSRINYFTCGYNTSSISESTNRRLKRTLPGRLVTLKEIREHMTFVEQNTACNKRYIKGRKLKKVRSPDIVDIMAKFNVAQSIAESISGSISKASELIVENTNEGLMVFKEEKVNIQAEENYTETYFILNGECSCKKQVNTGLPCSHYIRYLIETHQDIYSNITIAPRWTINKPQSFQFPTIIRNKVTYEAPDVIPIDNKERFNILRARAIALVQIASKDNAAYELMCEFLSKFEQELNNRNQEPVVIDAFCNRPGRPKKSQANNSELCCAICGDAHTIIRCPHRAEMLKFKTSDMQSLPNTRHCRICDCSFHNAATCPVKKAWLASKNQHND